MYDTNMSDIDTQSSVGRSAKHFLTGTFVSRITGMIRDLSLAFCFGTSPAVAAFMIAFRLANLFRRLFGEGALLNGFIPFFEGIRKDDPQKGALFFRDLFWTLCAVLIGLIFTLEVVFLGLLSGCNFSYETKQIIYMTIVK